MDVMIDEGELNGLCATVARLLRNSGRTAVELGPDGWIVEVDEEPECEGQVLLNGVPIGRRDQGYREQHCLIEPFTGNDPGDSDPR